MSLLPQGQRASPPASSPTRRGTGHPRVTQSDAPSLPPPPHGSAGSEDSVGIHRAVPATRRRFGASRGAPGLREDPLCSHMHAHTQTPAQDVSSLPPWWLDPDLCVTPSFCRGPTTGLGVESRRTPLPSHIAHWHLSPCFIPLPLQSQRPAGGRLGGAGSGQSRRDAQRGDEGRRQPFLPRFLVHPAC